jgi:hypothetical protein
MTHVKRNIITVCAASFLLTWTGRVSSFQRVDTSGLLAQRDNENTSYNRGYEQGRRDATRGDSDFRRGYEDGYAGRPKDNSVYGRMRNDGIYDRSRNHDRYGRSDNDAIYDRSADGSSYSGTGSMTWRGRVDDYVELNIQGNRVRSREREGAQTTNEQVSFSNPLPRANVKVEVRKRNGRGRVSVVQQPNQGNNYTAIVKIDDDQGGADDYEIEMEWR